MLVDGPRLGRTEVELQRAYACLDGSPAAWTRLAQAKLGYGAPEAAALVELGAYEALVPVEAISSDEGPLHATVGLLAGCMVDGLQKAREFGHVGWRACLRASAL